MTTSLRERVGAVSSKLLSTWSLRSTSTLAERMPPLTPAATRDPVTSTVIGLPALAGVGLTVMPQVGRQGLTLMLVRPVTPPEVAVTSTVPGCGAPGKVAR